MVNLNMHGAIKFLHQGSLEYTTLLSVPNKSDGRFLECCLSQCDETVE